MKGGTGLLRKKSFWSLPILLAYVVHIRRKLLKTTHAEERRVHTNSESCNIQFGSKILFQTNDSDIIYYSQRLFFDAFV